MYNERIEDNHFNIDLKTVDGSSNGINHLLFIFYENDKFSYQVINGGLGDERILFTLKYDEYLADITFNDDGSPKSTLAMALAVKFKENKLISSIVKGESEDEMIYNTLKWLKNYPDLPTSFQFKNYAQRDLGDMNKTKIIEDTIKIPINHGKYFLLDSEKREVRIINEAWSKVNNCNIVKSDEVFISGYPRIVELQQSPLNGSRIKYSAVFDTKDGEYPLKIGPGNINIILGELKESSIVLKSYNAEDHLTQLFYGLSDEGLVNKKFSVDKPGFFCIDGKIVSNDFECNELPSKEDINGALDVLEDFSGYFIATDINPIDQRDKLATLIKLGLTLPFNYVKKQIGLSESIKPPMAYGKPGSGKTTLFLLPSYLYGQDILDFEHAGSNVETSARFAELMGTSTFPIMVDECQKVFMDKGLVEMNKTGLRRLFVRNKLTKQGAKIEEPAYATFLYLSNFNPIENSLDGTVRRYHILHFEENEMKDDDDLQRDFDDKWKMREQTSPLKKLFVLGQFAAHKIIKNIDLLKLHPKDLGDKLIDMIYGYAERSIILWIKSWAEDEGIIDHRKEEDMIKGFIHKSVIDAHHKKIQIINDDERTETLCNTNKNHGKGVYKQRFFDVANERFISWFFNRKGHFFIKPGFIDDLLKSTNLSMSLKSVSQKFGWEYANILEGGKQQRMIRIPEEKFYNELID